MMQSYKLTNSFYGILFKLIIGLILKFIFEGRFHTALGKRYICICINGLLIFKPNSLFNLMSLFYLALCTVLYSLEVKINFLLFSFLFKVLHVVCDITSHEIMK